jgi:ribonuclease R
VLGLAGDKQTLHRLDAVLEELRHSGRILANRAGAYLLVARTSLATGLVQGRADGTGLVVLDHGREVVDLPPREMLHVFHGDRVAVRPGPADHRGRRAGEVVEVLARGVSELVGRYRLEDGLSFLVPNDPHHARVLLVPPDGRGGARDGQVVVAAITHAPDRDSQPLGRVREVLGEPSDPGMEIEIALRTFAIPHTWPAEARAQAAALGEALRPADRRDRQDLRALPWVTIDGADARDFDDAVCAERRPDGWRLQVAIADVSHYVPPGSALDLQARRRGTSVYFPGRVVPMLPTALSNGLCSLNPHEDRLALVCDMHLDAAGRVTRARLLRAVIRSQARLTYEGVQRVLDGDPGQRARHAALLTHLLDLQAVHERLAALREARGALDLDQAEPSFRLDKSGAVAAVESRPRLVAHRIVEECMIVANVEAARFLQRQRVPAPYRVHAAPEAEKVAVLRAAAARLGLPLGGGERPAPRHFAELLRASAGRPGEALLRLLVSRSLGRAVYEAASSGHFGLALEQYTHFTSPIRRYPDLLVHRAISHALAGGGAADFAHPEAEMEALCQLCSLHERRADEAVWDVHAWLKCRYMEDKVGQVFEGRISAAADFGLFVRLGDTLVEGVVHVSQLGADYFGFDAATQGLVGRSTGRRFELGDPLRVRCAAVRTGERRIDLALAGPEPQIVPASSSARPSSCPPASRTRRRRR